MPPEKVNDIVYRRPIDGSEFVRSRVIPWEDNWGDHSWALIEDGVVLSKHADQTAAEAARELLLEYRETES